MTRTRVSILHGSRQQAAGDKRSRNWLNQLIRASSASLFLKLHLTRVPRGMGHAKQGPTGVWGLLRP